ncbi:hypothetical protein Syun_001942 [Stephania yunnanensis]|uniref:Uncharacterized protein n=1 Tax=Stephania yunnanensis TaxID=152371 RepID=A0AAP0LGN8_9MAGN
MVHDMVADAVLARGDINWNLQLRRRCSDEELVELAQLLEILQVQLILHRSDQRSWGYNNVIQYTIQLGKQALRRDNTNCF